MLVYRGKKQNWIYPDTSKKIAFNSLVQSLRKEVENIVATDDKIEAIEIIDIDLTHRSK